MRLIRGKSQKEALHHFHDSETKQKQSVTSRRLELRSLLGRLIDVCNAIEYAHSWGVLHRNINPDNVMLEKFAETTGPSIGRHRGRDQRQLIFY